MNSNHDEARRRFLAGMAALATAPLAGAGAVAQTSTGRQAPHAELRPEAERLKLHYAQPASESKVLYEGLPIGNGHLGALVGGDPGRDFLYLCESTMWEGGRNDTLQDDGQFSYDASGFGSLTMLAKLFIDVPAHRLADITDYQRELDLSNGVARVRYRHGGVAYLREAFASHPDRALVVRLSQSDAPVRRHRPVGARDADDEGLLSGSIELAGTHGEASHSDQDGTSLWLAGSLSNGRRHAATLMARHEGGTVVARDGRLVFARCRELLLVLCAATDYLPDPARGFRYPSGDAAQAPLAIAHRRMVAAAAQSFATLLHAHVGDHRALFDTMAVDLGSSTPAQRALDTASRIHARAAPGSPADPELEALYLQYGRYLTIAGSRDGLPTALQGLWLAENDPPWAADYHNDVNLQMNYWLPDRAGLGNCFDALTRYCLAQVGSWTETTQRLFNDSRNHFRNSSGRIDGWTVAISTNPFGGNGWWWHPAGSAWLCNSLWQHVEYTNNPADAQRILPLLRGACAFWQSRLLPATVNDADGQPRDVLLADADWSPEHGPTDAKGITYAQELVWDLFNNYRACCAMLGAAADPEHDVQAIAAMQARLYLPRVSPTRGALEEWMSPDDLGEPHHRHLSPLIGLFPGDRITSDASSKALLDGCAQLLRDRGMESFGWACAWRALCWARLKQAETAYALVLVNLRPSIANSNGTAPNFFDVYSFGADSSAFQIDANFGTPTAMLEMLLYSRPGLIELLPALPKAWAKGGRVTGIGARGGFSVDLSWADGTVTAVRVRSTGGRHTVVKVGGSTRPLELVPGQVMDLAMPLAPASAAQPSSSHDASMTQKDRPV